MFPPLSTRNSKAVSVFSHIQVTNTGPDDCCLLTADCQSFSRLSIVYLILKIFTLMSRCHRTLAENRQFCPKFFHCVNGRAPRILDDHFQIWLTSKMWQSLVKFRAVISDDRTDAKYRMTFRTCTWVAFVSTLISIMHIFGPFEWSCVILSVKTVSLWLQVQDRKCEPTHFHWATSTRHKAMLAVVDSEKPKQEVSCFLLSKRSNKL